jgi:hypothetical protein
MRLFRFIPNRNRAAVTSTAVILIQASSAAKCSGKVAVLSNSPPEGGDLDELLYAAA